MKNILMTYNILFLLLGNTLFSNIHLLHHHDHCHDDKNAECQECLVIESSNTFILLDNELKFTTQMTYELFENTLNSTLNVRSKAFSSRAPPASFQVNNFSLI
tara:strand:- start:325 stop:633 length:309 start_codon:yes stop_codon:yes gene_type:complete